MDVLWEILAFAAKAAILVIAIVAVIAAIIAATRRGAPRRPHLEVRPVNERIERLAETVWHAILDAKSYKRRRKEKQRARRARAAGDKRPNLFVLDFHGDMLATGVDALRHEITALLEVAQKEDEVLVRLESSGGVVHAYGLAASQLVRIKQRGLRLVACIDKVAASGGYMMACVADRIVAAPFAVVGSIGVAAPVPNVHRLLEKHGVDYHEMTAGEFKRTVSLFGEITPKGKEKFQEQIEDVHALFKKFVKEQRPALDIDALSTGEHWHGIRALELGLIDALETSDDYLLQRVATASIWEIAYKRPRGFRERLASTVSAVLRRSALDLWGVERDTAVGG